MTVGEVKLQLQNTYLIPADHQRLFFSGVHLDNSRLLSAYGIGHNSILELLVDLHGRRRRCSPTVWRSVGRKANNLKKEEEPIDERDWVCPDEEYWNNMMDQGEISSWEGVTVPEPFCSFCC